MAPVHAPLLAHRTRPAQCPPTPVPTHPLRASFGYDVSYVGGSYLHYKCSVC